MKTWICIICGLIYDEASGWPDDGIPAGTPWAEALTWAAASGVAVGVSRLVATKGAATAKTKLTGKGAR